jgi:predicted nucleotidyltransferase
LKNKDAILTEVPVSMVIRQEIEKRLRDIEQTHSVVILFAVESGSRAWGFQSDNSDYDIRFVYKHNLDWYLSISKKRDVIEYPIEGILDFSGWDIQKALLLFSKSNPPLLEWLRSPILYLEQGKFRSDLRDLEKQYFSIKSCILHYLHMADGNYRDYLKSEIVKTKKYFYVLRPLLACEWIQEHETPPPMEFEILVNEVIDDNSVKDQIINLLSRKRSNEEFAEGPSIPVLNKFIEERLCFYEDYASALGKSAIDIEKLNQLFRKTIGLR